MRKRGEGTFIWNASKQTWRWKGWVTVEGVKVRREFSLGTSVRSIAEAKVKQLRESSQEPDDVAAPETFEEAARRIVEIQRVEGAVSWKKRLRRLEQYAFPVLGQLKVSHVRAEHIKDALRVALVAGRSKSLIDHVRDDCSSVLDTLWKDGRIAENVAKKAPVPANAPEDKRLHSIPTDDELIRLMSSGLVDIEVLAFAVCSRAVGGQRTSDMLIGADWANVDIVDWLIWRVYRPKTKTWDLFEIPAPAVGVLRDWWERSGQPTSGPLFPVTRGPRKGEKRKPGACFAKRLRAAFWAAGVRRPLPGYEKAQTEAERRALCAFQVDTATTRRLGAHDLRRAYVTAVNRSGAPAAHSMRLAGHTSWATHQRYIGHDVVLRAPEGAVPKLFSPKSLTRAISIDIKSKESARAVVDLMHDDAEPDEDAPRGQRTGRNMHEQLTRSPAGYSLPAETNRCQSANTVTCAARLATWAREESQTQTESDLLALLESLRGIDRGGPVSATGHLFRLIGVPGFGHGGAR